MYDISGKVALITGGGRGIGRAISLALAGQGCRVIVNYLRDHTSAGAVVDEIVRHGGHASAVQADVSEPKSVQRLQEEAIRVLGPVDILVNNAGAISRPADWRSQSDDDLANTIRVNLQGSMNTTRVFAPSMVSNGWGRIINVSSTYGITGAGPVAAYAAAKAGLVSYTYSIARELGASGVLVNAVAPGNVLTDLSASAGAALNEWAVSTTPLGRLGEPSEIADAVVFLCQTTFVHGHLLVVDGGHLLNM